MKTEDGKLNLPVTFLDLETNELAQDVGGWRHVDKLTMAVGITYKDDEPSHKRWQVWRTGEEIALCQYLLASKFVVGHNLFRFDYMVLWGALQRAPTLPIDLVPLASSKPDYILGHWGEIQTLDTLLTLKDATGRFLSLDNLAHSTLGEGKTDGITAEQVPAMLAEGQLPAVIAYCRQDVELLRKLLAYGLKHNVIWYIDTYTRKVRFTKPGWTTSFDLAARVKGTKIRKPRKT